MDPVALAHQATDILAPALPFIYAEKDVVAAKVHDMLLEKGIEKAGSKFKNKAKAIFDKLRSKGSEPVEVALEEVSKNPEDSKAKEELQQEILRLLKEDQNLAREIELTINFNVENINNLALGNYNTFFNFETPSGDDYIKIIEYLDERRKKAVNQEIMSRYNSSALPDYPDRLREFVTNNRADELKKALTHLEKHKILLISGVGGVGKTTLARALVDFRPINVPEPFWFSFYDNQDAKLSDILEEFAAYMKVPEIIAFKSERREPGKTDVNKFIGELNNRRETWFFFDDLSIVLESTKFSDKGIELLFSSLRYRAHNAKIIITSRVLPKLGNGDSLIDVVEDEEEQHLNGLDTDSAVDYLAKNGLDSLELDELIRLAEDVDGHPLALKLLIGLVNKFGVSDTLNDLNRYKNLKESTIKKTRRLFGKLAGNEKELLERISVYRQAETMGAIKIMFTDKTPIDAVDNLIDESLLETDHKGNYWLHPLVKKFSYDDLETKKGAHKLAMEYYLSLPLPQKSAKKEDAQSLIEAHYHACMAEEYDQAFHIIFDNNLHELLDLWGYYTLLIDLYSRMLPEDNVVSEVLLKEDKGKCGVILGNLGNAYFDLGEPRKAIEYYEKALVIAKEIEDRRNEGIWLGNLGNAYRHLGKPTKAIEYFKQALEIAKEIGDRPGEGNSLGHLGNAYRHLGEITKAIEYYEHALKIAECIGNRRNESIWLGNLGIAYRNLEEPTKAIKYIEKAIKIAKEIGDRKGEGTNLRNLGDAYRNLGESKKAIEYCDQGLKISREIGDRRNEGICLSNLGLAYRDLREPKRAIEYHEQSLEIAEEVGDKRGEGANFGNIGNAYRDLGEILKAIEYFEKAVNIAKDVDDRRGEGTRLGNLGKAYSDLGETRKAIEYYEQALSIGREIENPRIINFCEINLEKLKNSMG